MPRVGTSRKKTNIEREEIGREIQDDAEVSTPSSYLRKQVSMFWIPAFAGMTTE